MLTLQSFYSISVSFLQIECSLSLLVSPTATALTDQWVRVFLFSSALTSAKRFLSIWIASDFRWLRYLNPQLSDLIHDELDHRTTVSNSTFFVIAVNHISFMFNLKLNLPFLCPLLKFFSNCVNQLNLLNSYLIYIMIKVYWVYLKRFMWF